MNLLPKTHEEFSQADYWNTFFKKRGKKNFDWYGEFPELSEILLKYIKTKDDVLIVGCGNSTLSMSLYDVGYRSIVNIDISHIVIKQMHDINRNTRPDLVYEQMDATRMTYPDEKFSVVLDKGTLDALMPDTKESTMRVIDKYFKEITRVLRNFGRYICISLLQEHILRKLLSYFPEAGFMVRISRCHEAEAKGRVEEGSSIPVFVIVATKFTKLQQKILEISLANGPPERLPSIDDVISAVLSVQLSALVCNSLYKRDIADIGEISLDLHRSGDKHPRYTVYILDQPRIRGAKTYAAFIVPEGKETDWLFSTKEGRQQVLEGTQKDRLAIVIRHREHNKYEDWDAVKNELADCIRNLAPSGLSDKHNIPFLSMDIDAGTHKTCYEGNSESSGPFVVEEIEKDDYNLRRLVFLNNPYVIQSEARLKQAKSRRGKVKKIIDPSFLECKYHVYMTVGINAVIDPKEFNEILIVGLGGGSLCTFLYYYFTKLKITAVEIDKAMLQIARDYFGLPSDDRIHVEIMDGIEFVKNAASEKKKYRAILFDVDSKDTTIGMSFPPKQFLDISLLKAVASCLLENGLFILNLVSRDSNLKQWAKENLRSVFRSMVSYPLKDDVNEIVMCFVNESGTENWNNKIKEAVVSLNQQVMTTKKLFTSQNAFDVTSLIENLTIET